MICDIRYEVCVRAVCFAQDTVLIIAKASRFEPQRALFFISEPFFLEHLERCFHLAGITDRLLAAPHIKMHPVIVQILTDLLQFKFDALLLEEPQIFLCLLRIGILMRLGQADGDLFAILAMIAVFRK